MGFNPIAVTVNPGNIILPKYFQKNVEALNEKLSGLKQYNEYNGLLMNFLSK
jgi:predicted PP-loop superfamily ATPase